MQERGERSRWAKGFEHHETPAGNEHPLHLECERLRRRHVAHAKAAYRRAKRGVVERQIADVGLEHLGSGCLVASTRHHLRRQIDGDHALGGKCSAEQGREVESSGAQVEARSGGRSRDLGNDAATPSLVQPSAQDAVEEVVARGDVVEHRLVGLGRARCHTDVSKRFETFVV